MRAFRAMRAMRSWHNLAYIGRSLASRASLRRSKCTCWLNYIAQSHDIRSQVILIQELATVGSGLIDEKADQVWEFNS